MPFGIRRRHFRSVISPVLVVDELGLSAQIDQCQDPKSLETLALKLDRQFHGFQSKVPHKAMIVGRSRVVGTGEFSSLRLNDMFILFSERWLDDLPLRYLIAGAIIYHQLLNTGFIVRGGLGFGPVVQRQGLFIGRGFLDAYRMSEKRIKAVSDVCAILVSPSFFMFVASSMKCCKLLCLYEDHYFLHPSALTDPDLGEFDNDRILRCLKDSGANASKIGATKQFLNGFEDYDAAKLPNSRSMQLTGWKPAGEHTKTSLNIEPDDEPRVLDNWPSLWRELARVRGTSYSPSESHNQ